MPQKNPCQLWKSNERPPGASLTNGTAEVMVIDRDLRRATQARSAFLNCAETFLSDHQKPILIMVLISFKVTARSKVATSALLADLPVTFIRFIFARLKFSVWKLLNAKQWDMLPSKCIRYIYSHDHIIKFGIIKEIKFLGPSITYWAKFIKYFPVIGQSPWVIVNVFFR